MSGAASFLSLGAAVVLALCGTAGMPAGAAEAGPAAVADEAMGRRLQEALRAQRGEIHRCYAASLAQDPAAAGELLLRLVMGLSGSVARAEVLKDQSAAPGLAACLVRTMGTWRLPQLRAAAGDQVVFPLVFRPEDDDEGEKRPGGRTGAGVHDGREAGYGGVISPAAARTARGARVYVDAHGQPGTQGSLSLLTLRPGEATARERHGSTEVLYVVSGQGRLLGARRPLGTLDAGDAVLVPPGAARTLVAGKPPAGPLVVVQVFSPAGPEQRLLDKAAPVPVEGAATRDEGDEVTSVMLIKGANVASLPLPGGRAGVKILIDTALAGGSAGTRVPEMPSLEELTCEAGAEIPLHQHETSDELLYIVSGRGVMTAGERGPLRVGPGDAVRVPRFLLHSVKVTERLVAVQSYVPAGPEQRFRAGLREPTGLRGPTRRPDVSEPDFARGGP